MSAFLLVTALRNRRIVRQKPFHDVGMFPGPEPCIELPADKVLVDKEKGRLLIRMDDLIEVVTGVLRGKFYDEKTASQERSFVDVQFSLAWAGLQIGGVHAS